jgi:hypothetical protein
MGGSFLRPIPGRWLMAYGRCAKPSGGARKRAWSAPSTKRASLRPRDGTVG